MITGLWKQLQFVPFILTNQIPMKIFSNPKKLIEIQKLLEARFQKRIENGMPLVLDWIPMDAELQELEYNFIMSTLQSEDLQRPIVTLSYPNSVFATALKETNVVIDLGKERK